ARLGKYGVDDVLVWEERPDGASPPFHPARLFRDFVRLGEEPFRADHVLRFAQRHGVLALCQHGRPMGHPGPYGKNACRWFTSPEKDASKLEYLEQWKLWAIEANALMALSASTRDDAS